MRLSLRLLLAIQEALAHRLAGEIEDDGGDAPRHEDYEAAMDWVSEEIERRTR